MNAALIQWEALHGLPYLIGTGPQLVGTDGITAALHDAPRRHIAHSSQAPQ